MLIVPVEAVHQRCMCCFAWKGEGKKRERTGKTWLPLPFELTPFQMAHLHVKVQRKHEAICRPPRRAGVRSLFTRPCRLRLHPPTPRCVGWHWSPTHFPTVSLFHTTGTHNRYIKQLSNTALALMFYSVVAVWHKICIAFKQINNTLKILNRIETYMCHLNPFKVGLSV